IGKDGYFESPMYDIEIIDRIGAGDSFSAALIGGLIEKDLGYAVNLAAAFSALKQTIPGDVCTASKEETESLMKMGKAGSILR
ncbi:MAG: PfkB family carbohydrate kinase, partial [bacterium]